MQDFLHASHDEVLEAVERFEQMISTDKTVYFDVHQVESIYEFYLEKNMYDQAEKVLSIGLKQHPQSTGLKVKKASLLADHGQLEEALELLRGVAPIEKTNPEVFMTLGWIMIQKKDIESALSHFNQAAELAFDEQEEILLEIGYNLNQMDAYRESIYFLERLIDKYPNNENGLFELAFAYDKVGRPLESISTYESLLKINPFSENGWYNIGILYNKNDRYLEAIQAYDYTIAINPYHSEAYFNKGNSLVHHGLFQEALEAYLEHCTLSPDVALTYQYIADCWEQLGNFDMAIRFYKLVIKELPHNGDAWYGLGTALMEVKNFSGGLQAIDQAISINPLHADYWFAHARGLFELDKADDAARSLENGLNIDPEETTGWFELIKLKVALDPEFNINEFIKETCERYEDAAAVHYMATVAYFHYEKDLAQALIHFQRALEINADGLQAIKEDYPDFLTIPEALHLAKNMEK